VVDELVKMSDVNLSEKLRYRYTKTLCDAIDATTIVWNIFPEEKGSIYKVPYHCHVMVAAIYLEQDPELWQMLYHEDTTVAEVESEFFGTSLIAAVKTQRHDIISKLLQHGFDREEQGFSNSGTPIEIAVGMEDEKSVCLLLEYGCSTLGMHFESAITTALERNQPDIARFLLQHASKPVVNMRKHLLTRGLYAACQCGCIDIVRLLVDGEEDIKAVDDLSNPGSVSAGMIEQAAWKGQEEVLHYLLSRSLDPDGKCCSMYVATLGPHAGTLRILPDAGAGRTLSASNWGTMLERASQAQGSGEFVETLLDYGIVDINDIPHDKLLECAATACSRGNLGFVKALTERGVCIDDEITYDFIDIEFPPPIVWAKKLQQYHVVLGLLKLGIKDFDSDLSDEVSEYVELFRGCQMPLCP
jgi:ankyrin repeat protein